MSVTAVPTFSESLRAAMDERGYIPGRHTGGITRLSAESGVSSQTITNILRGENQPSPKTARQLADALGAPHLVILSDQPRRRYCESCHRRFTTTHNSLTRRRFCSPRCQERAWARKRYKGRATERLNGIYLREMQKAVEQFCGRCVGDDRACPDAGCELRQWSPMPLIQITRRAA